MAETAASDACPELRSAITLEQGPLLAAADVRLPDETAVLVHVRDRGWYILDLCLSGHPAMPEELWFEKESGEEFLELALVTLYAVLPSP